jgi:hypothetical protein
MDPVGYWFWLLHNGQRHSRVCLREEDAAEAGVVTPSMVLTEFRRLTWPSADLVVQPPDHRTLVNLPTILSTTLTGPRTQAVTLLGVQVTIEATPAAYTWHDGAGHSWSTTDPGRMHRSGDEPTSLNHALYTRTGTVQASVDVTYSGRFRIEDGPWQEIPGTHTVRGTAEGVEVLAAVPHLTGADG